MATLFLVAKILLLQIWISSEIYFVCRKGEQKRRKTITMDDVDIV